MLKTVITLSDLALFVKFNRDSSSFVLLLWSRDDVFALQIANVWFCRVCLKSSMGFKVKPQIYEATLMLAHTPSTCSICGAPPSTNLGGFDPDLWLASFPLFCGPIRPIRHLICTVTFQPLILNLYFSCFMSNTDKFGYSCFVYSRVTPLFMLKLTGLTWLLVCIISLICFNLACRLE